MSTIFPGMDPYLEVPELWPDFHNSLIVYIRDSLRPLLQPRYIAAIEERVFVEGPQQREIIPDVFLSKAVRAANAEEQPFSTPTSNSKSNCRHWRCTNRISKSSTATTASGL